jgi:hypothetical protein
MAKLPSKVKAMTMMAKESPKTSVSLTIIFAPSLSLVV